MDIRSWPIDMIMQLPDCCLGRKFRVFVEAASPGDDEVWDISEVALPDKCILWGLSMLTYTTYTGYRDFRLALGDQLPTTEAQMNVLEPLIAGLGITEAEPRSITLCPGLNFEHYTMKQYLPAQGRRLVLGVRGFPLKITLIRASIEVSSVPTEVPDCLLSAQR